MNNHFAKLNMAKFSEQFKGQKLIAMHNTNPEPFTQSELETTIGQSFNAILTDTPLGFAPDAGSQALRQTLAKFHYQTIQSEEIITHAGAQEALFCTFQALLKKNDRVLVVTPVFEPLMQIPKNIGCDVITLPLQVDSDWSLDLDAIEKEFKQGCRLLVINFPHNPTGVTITQAELKQIVDLCEKYAVWLLSDEVFRGLEHSKNIRLPAVADLYEKGISVGVISKAFAVPGIRVGWLACKNKMFLERIIDVKGYLSICNSQIDEKLASVILQQPESLLQRNLNIVLKNKELLGDLTTIGGEPVELMIPNAGCCLFAKLLNKSFNQSIKLVNKLAEVNGYLLYPSSLFYTKIEGVRIGFGSRDFEEFINKNTA